MTAKAMAFGRIWASDTTLHAFTPRDADPRPADVAVRRREALRARGAPAMTVGNGALYPDGLRLAVRDEACFDVFAGGRIDWSAGAGWSGAFPPEMFSVVAATGLAMLGDLPLHGSAVELDGKAILLCGAAGTGKSTLAAGMTLHGARLVSDDLSVVALDAAGAPVVHLGRPSVRLFPEVARTIVPGIPTDPAAIGPRGKYLGYPVTVAPDRAIPLRTIVLLEGPAAAVGGEAHPTEALLGIQFRPNWMRRLPSGEARLARLDALSRRARIVRHRIPAIADAAILARLCAEIAGLAANGGLG